MHAEDAFFATDRVLGDTDIHGGRSHSSSTSGCFGGSGGDDELLPLRVSMLEAENEALRDELRSLRGL